MSLFNQGLIALDFDAGIYMVSTASWLTAIVSCIVMSGAVISVIFGVFRDLEILSQKLLSQVEELTDRDELLNSVINGIVDPVFLKDDKHHLIVVNDALCAVAGKKREQLIGNAHYGFMSDEEEKLPCYFCWAAR